MGDENRTGIAAGLERYLKNRPKNQLVEGQFNTYEKLGAALEKSAKKSAEIANAKKALKVRNREGAITRAQNYARKKAFAKAAYDKLKQQLRKTPAAKQVQKTVERNHPEETFKIRTVKGWVTDFNKEDS